MLTILPDNDRNLIDIYNPTTDNATALVCKDKDKMLGYIVVEEIKGVLSILAFELTDCKDTFNLSVEDNLNGDALIRSAGSYALNRAICRMECENKLYFNILSKFGFTEIDNKMSINLEQLFKVCKNH